jgi:hypothetical protein
MMAVPWGIKNILTEQLLFYVQAFSMIMSMTGRFLGIITTTTETDQLFVEEAMEEPPTHSS